MKMEITSEEIAKAGLCTEGSVLKAKQRGRLDSVEGLVSFVLGSRLKELGAGLLDDLTDLDTR